jgi:hypothetical protein
VTVLAFRRRKPASPVETRERCPSCGWLLPVEVRADPSKVSEDLVLYLTCPECSADLILSVKFTS